MACPYLRSLSGTRRIRQPPDRGVVTPHSHNTNSLSAQRGTTQSPRRFAHFSRHEPHPVIARWGIRRATHIYIIGHRVAAARNDERSADVREVGREATA